MSKIVQHIALNPALLEVDNTGHYIARGFRCPKCCGRGYLGGIAHNEEKEPCSHCAGTGLLKAIVTVRWASDYDDTRWQPQ